VPDPPGYSLQTAGPGKVAMTKRNPDTTLIRLTSNGGLTWSDERVGPAGWIIFDERWYWKDKGGNAIHFSDDEGASWTKLVDGCELSFTTDDTNPRALYLEDNGTVFKLIGPPPPREKNPAFTRTARSAKTRSAPKKTKAVARTPPRKSGAAKKTRPRG